MEFIHSVFIDYPSLPFISSVFIKAPVPLNGKSFSFYNRNTYDAMYTNHIYNNIRVFYLCQGCFLSEQYEMQEETKKGIEKKFFRHTIKLEK